MGLYDTVNTVDTMSTMSTADVGDSEDSRDVVEFGRLWRGLQRNTLSRSGGKFSDFNFTLFLGDTGIFLYSSDHRG